MSRMGPVSYIVNVGGAGTWKRHVDQLLKQGTQSSETQMEPEVPVCSDNSQAHPLQENAGEKTDNVITDKLGTGNIDKSLSRTVQTRETIKRYPIRLTKPPDRYQAS